MFYYCFCILVSVLVLVPCRIFAFNLDTQNPIIITNKGETSSFGFSTVLLNEGNVAGDSNWVIIGSPNAKDPNLNVVKPGVIWRCSLGRSTRDNCELVPMDEKGNEDQEYWDPGGMVINFKNNMGLGEAMHIGNSEKFLSCAPRWSNVRANVQNGSYHNLMNGLCYWRPKAHLTQFELPQLQTNHTLIPLRNNAFQTNCGQSCSKFQWPFGQAGFSAFLIKDEAILGAPGVFDWKGGVIKLSDNELAPLARNGQKAKNAEFFRSPPFVLNSTLQPELSSSQSGPYFGYSVTSGNYFTSISSVNGGTQFASGAPRGGPENNHLSGHVTIFTFPQGNQKEPGPKPLNVLQILDGPKEQIGTYFGSVLCTIDLDHDGNDDLLVGAPHYTRNRQPRAPIVSNQEFSVVKQQQQRVLAETYSGYGDEGAVFVYLSNGNFMEIKKVLHGNGKPWSRFGTAISNLGDINRDGIDDFVVGAPFENDNRGVIYIYHGFKYGTLPNDYKASQIIPASKVDRTLRRFGFSFSNGVDVDKNGYNDLAIGAPSSGQVVILRSSPIVSFSGILNSTISNYPLESKNFNFTFSSCVKYIGTKVPIELKIKVKLTSDVDSLIKRVLIKDPLNPHVSGSQQIIYTETLTFGQTVCREYLGVAIKTLLSSYNAIKIRQEISIPPASIGGSKGPTLYNIASSQRLSTDGPSFNSFCSACPIIDDVSTEPVLLALPFTQGCGEDDECATRMTIFAKWVELKSSSSFTMGTMDKITLEIIIVNEEELAFHPEAIISWTSRSLLRLPSNCRQTLTHNSNQITCALGIYMKRNENVTMYLEFDMSDLVAGEQGTPNTFIITINSTTTSKLIEPSFLNFVLPIMAQADLSISCQGLSTNEIQNFIPESKNPFFLFQQGYQVLLDGPSTLGHVELAFNIPTKLEIGSGKSLSINITKTEANYDGTIISCLPTAAFAQDMIIDNGQFVKEYSSFTGDSRLRRKREISSKTPTTKLKDLINKNNELKIDCSSLSLNLVHCEYRICQLKKVKPGSIINVDLILKISTEETLSLIDQTKITKLIFESNGKSIIQNINSDINIQPIPNKPDQATCKVTIILSDEIATWIIASSVIGGLLLVICIAICLCACGAFDRKKFVDEDEDETHSNSPESIPLNPTIPESEDGVERPLNPTIPEKQDELERPSNVPPKNPESNAFFNSNRK